MAKLKWTREAELWLGKNRYQRAIVSNICENCSLTRFFVVKEQHESDSI